MSSSFCLTAASGFRKKSGSGRISKESKRLWDSLLARMGEIGLYWYHDP